MVYVDITDHKFNILLSSAISMMQCHVEMRLAFILSSFLVHPNFVLTTLQSNFSIHKIQIRHMLFDRASKGCSFFSYLK